MAVDPKYPFLLSFADLIHIPVSFVPYITGKLSETRHLCTLWRWVKLYETSCHLDIEPLMIY